MKNTGESRARVLAVAGAAAALCASTLAVTNPGANAAPSGWEAEFGSSTAVSTQDETGLVGFVGSAAGSPLSAAPAAGTSATAAATAYLRDHAAAFGLTGTTLTVSSTTAAPGGTSVRVQQVIDGVPVMGGEFAVTLDDSERVTSVLGEATPAKQVWMQRTVSAAQARATALASVRKATRADGLTAGVPELRVYDSRLLGAPAVAGGPGLAWVVQVGDGHTIGKQVVVDARRPVVALALDTVHAALDRTVCDANNTSTQVPCTAPVRTESNPPQSGDDADVRLAFDYTGDTYNFFRNRFGWDSLDGQGMQLKTTVDYCDSTQPCPYQNAFWNGEQMVYGDTYASADDVVGHELSHGFTDHTSSLYYYAQSGAINESMSDVFGELLDQSNGDGDDSAAARWRMGEDLPIGAIRNMADPTEFGDPDRMLSPIYMNGMGDNEGVHYNSGVNNKAAFLMTDGGTFNGQTITGLGLDKVARLYFTVNSTKLVSGSDYADLANALRQSCTDLAAAGTNGFTPADCGEVDKVLKATEMDANPPGAATKDASVCPTGQSVLSTAYADNLESPTGQFTPMAITGSHWFYPQNSHSYEGWDATWASSGRTNAWGDDTDEISDSALRMTNPVTVPAGGQLHFKHTYSFEWSQGDALNPAEYYDGGVLEYSTSGASGPWLDAGSRLSGLTYNGKLESGYRNPLGGKQGFGGSSRGYGSTRVDLSDLAGQQIMFRWRIGTDRSEAYYGWFVDDITIASCGTLPPTTPPATPPTTPPTPPTRDTTAPDTKIKKHPKKATNARTAKFKFSSSEAGSTFQCKLDKNKWKSCKSTLKLKKLKPGKHVLKVRAIDAAGNRDASPAKWKWRVRR